MFKKKIKIINKEWEFFQFHDEDGLLGLVLFDTNYLEEKSQKSYQTEILLYIIIPEDKLHLKIPTPEENQYLNKIEDDLISLLQNRNVDCKQVVRLTYDGKRQFVFECNNTDKFMQVFDDWETNIKGHEIEVYENQVWETYNRFLPDKYDWQQIGNRHVIDQLTKVNSNFEKEHFIEHVLIGNQKNLSILKEKLVSEGFHFISLTDEILDIGYYSLVSLDEITSQTSYLIDAAEQYQVEYDGLSTSIIR